MSNLLRSFTVDLDKLARSLLVREDFMTSEVTLEVYRHIVVTGEERDRRWRKRDPWAHERYPNFHRLVGATYRDHIAYTRFALTDHLDMGTHVPRIIARAVLGNDPTLARWRRDQGNSNLRPLVVTRALSLTELPCRISIACGGPGGDRTHDRVPAEDAFSHLNYRPGDAHRCSMPGPRRGPSGCDLRSIYTRQANGGDWGKVLHLHLRTLSGWLPFSPPAHIGPPVFPAGEQTTHT